MKKMLVTLIVFFSIFLTSCEPESYFFKNNSRNDEVVSIELISYVSDEVAVIENIEEMLDIEISDIDQLEVLDVTENEEFITDFSNIEFFLGYSHLNLPDGIGVKINYNNGDFLIVTDSFNSEQSFGGNAVLYDSEGKFIQYYGSFSWKQDFEDLINSYFITQVEEHTD